MGNSHYPFRDKQQDRPVGFCALCGGEQYEYDPPTEDGLCPACRRQEVGKENAMTLREMSKDYRAQAGALRERMQELKDLRGLTEDEEERERLALRIWTLEVMWRETREQAVLLERYYERGYRRNARYTL